MQLSPRLLLAGGIALFVIVGGIIFLVFNTTSNNSGNVVETTNPDNPTAPGPTAPLTPSIPEPEQQGEEQHALEDHGTTGLLNASLLTAHFTLSQASFINMKVVEHAQQQLGKEVVYIGGDEVTPRGANAYGFTVNDDTEALFYVIVTMLSDGNVKVDIY